MSSNEALIYLIRAMVLVSALPVHECAHGWVASKLGDDTARRQGRLTLNPFKHLDLFGSVLMIYFGFGWAKPVPVDPRNFKKPRQGMAISALAGPMSNVLMAYVLLCIYKVVQYTLATPAMRYANAVMGLLVIISYMVTINLYLAVFNLLPIPPLDGSKIFGLLLPKDLYFQMMRHSRQITMVLFMLVFVLMRTGMLSGPLTYLSGKILVGLDFLSRPIDLLLG